MNLSTTLDHLHLKARQNKWLHYFAIFNRIALAAGFIPSGMQKVLGERFTVLSANHPMGNFLEAFFHTGYYYTFVGYMQVIAAVLLLIPRTATLGAFIYFPIILNICVLSLAVRFDGSQVTSPLMLCAVLYLLCWDYHKFRDILPFRHAASKVDLPGRNAISSTFPVKFFAGVLLVIVFVVGHTSVLYKILPRNTITDCKRQCDVSEASERCIQFCECIHTEGNSLDACLSQFNTTPPSPRAD
ncbi:MAG: DoxX family protein [Bacteroidota bacterium]